MSIQNILNSMPQKIENATVSIAKIQEQITELASIADDFENILETISTEFTETLLPAKGDYVYIYDNFGISNVTDWKIYDNLILNDLTFISDTSFSCYDDKTLIFIVDADILCNCGIDGIKICNVVSSDYSDDTTTISLSGDIITNNLESVKTLSYQYNGIGWDSDTIIINKIVDFNFTYDYLNKTIDTSGTYGIYDMISKLTVGKNLTQINKTKYEDSITIFTPYI